jgi:hypothetical protein
MKILIIDNDVVSSNLMKSRLVPLGHIVEITEKNDNYEQIIQEGWDVICLDPSPLTTLRPLVMNIRRANRRSVYMILTSNSLGFEDALGYGFNNFMKKPIDMSAFLDEIDFAGSLMSLQKHLSSDKDDFPSAGGVIAKSAFNQLFLSCLDRADRYGEISHVIFITIDNYNQLSTEAGPYDANLVSAKLANQLVKLRRQSDIIAQTRENEYALLLLRPMSESEPLEAAHRFAESLSKCTDIAFDPRYPVHIRVLLMRLPTGETGVEHRMVIHQQNT